MTNTRLYLVTPCLNASATLDETISSVAGQAGDVEIFYHVQDGGSDDDTIELLQAWEHRLNNNLYPINCRALHFSFSSEKDAGMYDAISKGFARFDMQPNDWMAWINADDVFSYGATAFLRQIDQTLNGVHWVGGKAALIKTDFVALETTRPVNSDIIREGLCDGVHWEFIQQEGVFFRNALWRRIDASADFSNFKLAGDWNLWRHFAHHERYYQAQIVTGYFRQHTDQLSVRHKDTYRSEIDSTVSVAHRNMRFNALKSRDLQQDTLLYSFDSGSLVTSNRSLENHFKYRSQFVLSENKPAERAIPKAEATQHPLSITEVTRKRTASLLADAWGKAQKFDMTAMQGQNQIYTKNIVGYDNEWQYPAITEQHAFKKALEILPPAEGKVYVAFPWATLIDKLNNNSSEGPELLARLLSLNLPKTRATRLVTVCQHILTLHFQQLFFDAGITDIFWSHAIKGQSVIRDGEQIQIHPFPLYPVQIEENDSLANNRARKHLYSFVGAKANKWYLTEVRDWILDILQNDARGFVVGRDAWHYHKVVYEHQIKQKQANSEKLVDDHASLQFSQIMQDSIFALCPSGSGPNSIRLWEAIGMGAIPVILAETYDPPGNPALWEEAAVFCEESPEAVRNLPDRLEEMAKDSSLIERKRKALRQLWLLYGPDTFIYDVQKLFYRTGADSHHNHAQLLSIAKNLTSGLIKNRGDFDAFLDLCAARLSLQDAAFIQLFKTDKNLHAACLRCLRENHDTISAQRFREAHSAALETPLQSSPAINLNQTRKRVRLFGKHSHRTPLSYPAYRSHFDAHLDVTTLPKRADFIISGFDLDFVNETNRPEDHDFMKSQAQFMVLSEEPLWDTMWSREYINKANHLKTPAGDFSYAVVNHLNSDVYNFDRIPYFITTEDDYLVRYVNCFRRNSALSVDDLLQHWNAQTIRTAFYAEKRDDEKYNYQLPEHDIHGLSAYRTRLAQQVSGGESVRVGKGWADQKMRQKLPDWHLDKFAAVDRGVLILSGLENTHQRQYITEKLFDAFAALAVPIYYASPDHRVHDLLPEGGFINLYGASIEEAVRIVDSFSPDRNFAQAYLETQKKLYALFADPLNIHLERSRVASAVIREMNNAVLGGSKKAV